MTYKIDSNKILEFLTRVTQEAGKRILTYSKGNLGVTLKDDRPDAIDIVTDADRASEDFILDAINREFPEHDILTEERSIELKGSPMVVACGPPRRHSEFRPRISNVFRIIGSHGKWRARCRHGL